MAQNSKSILEIWPLNHLSMYLRLPGARCWKHVPDIRYQNKVLCRGKSHIAIGMTLNDTLCQNPYIFADYHVWQDVKKRKEKV